MKEIVIIFSILIALPLLLNLLAGYFKIKTLGYYDLENPRQQSSILTGIGQRAISAQKNSWEALLIISCTLFITALCRLDQADILLGIFLYLISRIFYICFYLINWSICRAITWAFGIGICSFLILRSYMNLS